MNDTKSTYNNILKQYQASNNFGNNLGMVLTNHEPEKITYKLTITKDHLATPVAAHGGVVAAFMDGLLGVTALSAVANDNKVVATVEFKINYLEPVLVNNEIIGHGKVVRKGSRLVMTEAKVYCKEKLIATASGTFNAYPASKAGININTN